MSKKSRNSDKNCDNIPIPKNSSTIDFDDNFVDFSGVDDWINDIFDYDDWADEDLYLDTMIDFDDEHKNQYRNESNKDLTSNELKDTEMCSETSTDNDENKRSIDLKKHVKSETRKDSSELSKRKRKRNNLDSKLNKKIESVTVSADDLDLKRQKSAAYLRQYRTNKKLKSLELPADNFKRTFIQDMKECHSTHNWEKLKLIMSKHVEPDLIVRITLENSFFKLNLKGIDNLISLSKGFMESCPDRVDIVEKVIVRNSVESNGKQRKSVLFCETRVEYTIVFQLLMKINDGLEYLYETFKRVTGINNNLQSKTKDPIEISPIGELKPTNSTEPLQFTNGRVLTEKLKKKHKENSKWHFNEKDMVYLLEINVTEIIN